MPKIDTTLILAGVIVAIIVAFLAWIYPQINKKLPSLDGSI